MKDDAETRHQRSNHSEANSAQDSFDGSRQIQSHHQLQAGNRRYQVALMYTARLVVNVEHAAADHDGNIHCQRYTRRQQELHVTHIGIKFHNVQCNIVGQARLDQRGTER